MRANTPCSTPIIAPAQKQIKNTAFQAALVLNSSMDVLGSAELLHTQELNTSQSHSASEASEDQVRKCQPAPLDIPCSSPTLPSTPAPTPVAALHTQPFQQDSNRSPVTPAATPTFNGVSQNMAVSPPSELLLASSWTGMSALN